MPKIFLYASQARERQKARTTMKSIEDRVRPKAVTISAEANFTVDMAQNLLTMFSHLSEGQEITVKFSNAGVWAVTPHGIRLFIGSTQVFEVGGNDDDAGKTKVQ